MKRFICILLICLIIFSMTSCAKTTEKSTESISYPFKSVDSVYDRYGNILQQIIYNEETEKYIIKEYEYTLIDDTWICVEQNMYTMINNPCTDKHGPSQNKYTNFNESTLVLYKNDLTDRPYTIIDNEYIRITVIRYLEDGGWYDFAYEFKVENKTDQVLTFSFENMSIMNISCPAVFSIDYVYEKETKYFLLGWSKDTLSRCYIPYIDRVNFQIKIYDNEDWRRPADFGEQIIIMH